VKAARYHGRGDLRVEEVAEPVAGPGEVLLEVHAVGVCGTDAAEWAHGPIQYPIARRHPVTGHEGPMTPGHELAGRVVALGEGVDGLEVGAVVACGAGYTVAEDAAVAAGRPNLSRHYATVGLQRDGGLAQYCSVPASTCLDVRPYGLAEDAAALAQPMAIAVHSFRRGRGAAGETALVLGVGGIGAFLVYAASEARLHVVAVDLDPERLETALRLGAAETLDAREQPELPRAQVVYEVSGTEAGLASALGAVERGGRVVLVGLHERPRELNLRSVTIDELELLGTNAHVFHADLPEAVRVLATRAEPWSDVAPYALPLEELVDGALRPLAEQRSERIKTLIDPWASERRPTRMDGA
jgi:(R,R)-butanediol dehydrogenase/meso-butanediol dehydrogenase/diacetyl reductase